MELQRNALQEFVVGNNDLAALEVLGRRFNMFEALGAVRDERKHSNFLAFLMNPRASHGLDDRFLKRFLQSALLLEPDIAPVSPIEIDLSDLSQAEVDIEHDRIDIFVCDEKNGLCVILENKVDSSEHSDQLSKYYALISGRYAHAKVVGIYLTVDGEPPEKEEDQLHYIPFPHSKIRDILGELLATQGARVQEDVRFAINQYRDVLGRHFMADEEITGLCQKIYRQHKQAIDLIISNLPDTRTIIRNRLIELVKAEGERLLLDDCSSTYVRFMPKALDVEYFRGGSGWTTSGRFVLFEFQIRSRSLVLVVQMGPSSGEKRRRIHEFVRSKPDIFQAETRFYEKWQTLFRKTIVEDIDGSIDQEELIQTVEGKWKDFLGTDLPRIERAFLGESWVAAGASA